MDILTGLSAASHALEIIKQVRDLDRASDDAVFKAKIIELQEALFDAKSALLDAKDNLLEKDLEIRELKAQIDIYKSGDICPQCGVGRLIVVSSRDSDNMPGLGIKEMSRKCSNEICDFTDSKIHDPSGLIVKK